MISSLRLQNFRSYADNSFEFDKGVNIIIGPNASGKTNLLEAILVACQGRSYRGNDLELVRHQKQWSRIDAFTENNQTRILKIKIADLKADKTFTIDGNTFKRLSLPRTIPTVLFEPNQLQMLISSPEQRRNFIDDLLEQTVLDFGTTKRSYLRALAQRNRLLKDETLDKEQLFVWNIRLSDLGAAIVSSRQQLLQEINKNISSTYQEIAHSHNKVALQYKSKVRLESYGSDLLKLLDQATELDRLRGFTSLGPHRDDILISIDDQPLSSTASRGEARTLLLALKIQEARSLSTILDQKPILLLDDVFGELDETRRLHLTRFLKDYQSFITTPDIDMTRNLFKKSTNYITM